MSTLRPHENVALTASGKYLRVFDWWMHALQPLLPSEWKRRLPISRREITQLLPPRAAVVEAGAFDGHDTAQLARLLQRGQVYSFEPVPDLYAQAARRTARYPNVKLFQCALGRDCGEAEFFVSSNRGMSSSLLPPGAMGQLYQGVTFSRIRVSVTTLDAWAESNGIQRVDALWLDLQGHELAALQGATRLLEGVRVIFTEVNFLPIYAGGALYHELHAWLFAKGFQVLRIDFPHEDQGNVLFHRP
jgi:FkbM family methyltransferase